MARQPVLTLADVETLEDARAWLVQHRDGAARANVHMLGLQLGIAEVGQIVRELGVRLVGEPGE
jgi:hypothetical protein